MEVTKSFWKVLPWTGVIVNIFCFISVDFLSIYKERHFLYLFIKYIICIIYPRYFDCLLFVDLLIISIFFITVLTAAFFYHRSIFFTYFVFVFRSLFATWVISIESSNISILLRCAIGSIVLIRGKKFCIDQVKLFAFWTCVYWNINFYN